MKKMILVVAFFLSSCAMRPWPAYAAESINLSKPHSPNPEMANDFKIEQLILSFTHSIVAVELRSSDGIRETFIYEGDEARDMMIALNKSDLRTNSLQKRIFNKLIQDGKLEGTVVGLPD